MATIAPFLTPAGRLGLLDSALAFFDLTAVNAIRTLQATMPEPWRSKPKLTVQEIFTWVMLRRAMQSAGDNARKEAFDRIEGRPTLKIAGPTGGPIETISYDLKKLTREKIRLIRTILAEAEVEAEKERPGRHIEFVLTLLDGSTGKFSSQDLKSCADHNQHQTPSHDRKPAGYGDGKLYPDTHQGKKILQKCRR